MNYKDYLVYLNLMGIENQDIEKIEEFISEKEIDISEIFRYGSLKDNFSKSIGAKLEVFDKDKLDRLYEYCQKKEINILSYSDENYPDRLRYIENFPRILYTIGEFIEDDYLGVSIVGSRKHSDYGKVVVNYIVDNLKTVDATIISGMAYGIDSLSHNRALINNMRTIAVLGCGVDVVYPKSNTKIYNEIVNKGVVCSEYAPGVSPMPYRFPLRNRIISGLGLVTVVIEARHKSGSLITARVAAEQGREVFAVPGNINSIYSEGTNSLIRDGVSIFSSIDDLLDILPKKQKKSNLELDLDEDEVKIVEAVKEGSSEINILANELNLKISDLNSILTILELKEIIIVNGKNITLTIK